MHPLDHAGRKCVARRQWRGPAASAKVAPVHRSVSRPPTRIPPVIKRNTALFALSQSFTGAGMQFAYGLGPLMVIALTGSAALAGLSVGLIGLSRFLVAYPVGKITDTYGRKPGILFGLALALVGAVMVGVSIRAHSFS